MTNGIIGYEDALAKIAYQSAAVRLSNHLTGAKFATGIGQDAIALTLFAAYPLLDVDRIRLDVATSESFYYKLLQKQQISRHTNANGDIVINVG